jgi:glutathione S-transferase
MITLYGGGPSFGLPEVSPYVTKTEVQLKMAGLDYVKAVGAREESPKGQVPYIDEDGVRIADSTFIRAYLEEKHGIDLDRGLTPRQRAEAWAIERLLENHFSWTVGWERWLVPANFEKGPSHFFDGLPDQVKADVLVQVEAAMRAVGIARHAPDEIAWLAEKSLIALSEILADKPYLMGDEPCAVDATAFAMLAAALTPFFAGGVGRRARRFPNLVAYVERMMALYYPEFEWRLPAAA